jgi:bis(5'-nucleosidyl)-tetraphosphatase
MARTRSAGIVPLREVSTGWQVLLLRVYRTWDFPKGTLLPEEGLLEAARREAREEAGLTDMAFEWGYESIDTEPYGRNKVATYFVARVKNGRVFLPVNPELGRPEHHEARWMSLDDADRVLPPRLQRVLRWARGMLQPQGE